MGNTNMPSCNPFSVSEEVGNDGMLSKRVASIDKHGNPLHNNQQIFLRNMQTVGCTESGMCTTLLPDGQLELIIAYWGYGEGIQQLGGNTGITSLYPSGACEYFDLFHEDQQSQVEMRCGRYNHSSCVQNGRVYVFGGYNGNSSACMTIDYLEMKTLHWKTQSAQDMPRISTACVSVLAGAHEHTYTCKGAYIYLTGGTNGERFLKHVLRFNPSSSAWSKQPTMTYGRMNHNQVHYDGYLIALGGTGEDGELDSVEILDLSTGRYNERQKLLLGDAYVETKPVWECIASLQTRRSSACVGILDGVQYVMGGHNGNETLSSTEILPLYKLASESIFNLQWSFGSELQHPRSGASCVVQQASYSLLVCGGFTGTQYLSSTERLTPYPVHAGSYMYNEQTHVRDQQLSHVYGRMPVRKMPGIKPDLTAFVEEDKQTSGNISNIILVKEHFQNDLDVTLSEYCDEDEEDELMKGVDFNHWYIDSKLAHITFHNSLKEYVDDVYMHPSSRNKPHVNNTEVEENESDKYLQHEKYKPVFPFANQWVDGPYIRRSSNHTCLAVHVQEELGLFIHLLEQQQQQQQQIDEQNTMEQEEEEEEEEDNQEEEEDNQSPDDNEEEEEVLITQSKLGLAAIDKPSKEYHQEHPSQDENTNSNATHTQYAVETTEKIKLDKIIDLDASNVSSVTSQDQDSSIGTHIEAEYM